MWLIKMPLLLCWDGLGSVHVASDHGFELERMLSCFPRPGLSLSVFVHHKPARVSTLVIRRSRLQSFCQGAASVYVSVLGGNIRETAHQSVM
jgi:hypothetical protein